MSREPVAEIGAEDYRIVRHTHDVELAEKLMRARLLQEYGCPGDGTPEGFCTPFRRADCPHAYMGAKPGRPRQVWCRILPCLPNSYGAAEGWKFEYRTDAKPHSRGAFPAVVFAT